MKRRPEPAGVITGRDGTRILIHDARVAAMLEQGQRDGLDLADYRIAWQELTTRHNALERHWWSRLGRALRAIPRPGTASQTERRVVASELRQALSHPVKPYQARNGIPAESTNGIAPHPAA